MKLLTKAIQNKLPKLYATDGKKEKKIVAKFFTPWTSWTWYVVEGQQEGNDWRFFGYVDSGHTKEWGYFHLSELQASGRFGLKIERDLHFDGKTIDMSGTIR